MAFATCSVISLNNARGFWAYQHLDTARVISLSVKRILEQAGLDSAVVFTLLTRAWQAGAGAATLLLVAYFFTSELQGFYYTFSSLLALQVFVELGLYLVVVNRASHEWSKLVLSETGDVMGDAAALSRLASLLYFVVIWYAAASVLFAVGVGVSGYLFLANSPSTNFVWHSPWAAAVALAAIQLSLLPLMSLLEGCNQVTAISQLRFRQAIAETIAIWALLAAGLGLWVVAGALFVRVAATLLFILGKYLQFFRSILAGAGTQRILWRKEIWPMQWRLGAQGLVNFFIYSMFVPIVFHFHGPVAAGQTGMTLQIISVVQLMALAWVQTKVPLFGMLVAKRQFDELDRVWKRASTLSFAFTIAGSGILWAAVFILSESGLDIGTRMLGPLPTGLFLLAYGLMQIVNFYASYLRAHGREPFLVAGVLGGVLMGSLIFSLGSRYGPTGAATGFLISICLFTLPMGTLIWIRRRKEWQN